MWKKWRWIACVNSWLISVESLQGDAGRRDFFHPPKQTELACQEKWLWRRVTLISLKWLETSYEIHRSYKYSNKTVKWFLGWVTCHQISEVFPELLQPACALCCTFHGRASENMPDVPRVCLSYFYIQQYSLYEGDRLIVLQPAHTLG